MEFILPFYSVENRYAAIIKTTQASNGELESKVFPQDKGILNSGVKTPNSNMQAAIKAKR